MVFEINGIREGSHLYRRFAGDLLFRVTLKRSLLLLIPVAAATSLVCWDLAYAPDFLTDLFWSGVLVPLLLGLGLLYFYRHLLLQNRLRSPLGTGLGLAGVACILAAYFLLFCGAGLLVMPEKWPFLSIMPGLMLSWNGVAKFLEFLTLAFATTGAGILLFSSLAARRELQDPEYCRFGRKVGAVLALAFLLLWPFGLLFDLFTLPGIALSGGVFVLAASALVLSAATGRMLLAILGNRERDLAGPVFVAFLALFLLWILTDHLGRENALAEQILPAGPGMETPRPAAEVPVAEKVERAINGQAVFARACSGCHRFDQRLVGPPLNAVLPGYQQDPGRLKAFVRDPVKKDPAYPPMPRLGLSEKEIAAVVGYVLEKAGK